MEKKLACYDIDGTLTTEMLFVPLIKSELANDIISSGTYTQLLTILHDYKNGATEYEVTVQSLLTCHANGLKGKTAETIEHHAKEFIRSNNHLFRSVGKEVITVLQDHLIQVAVTAEPQYVADAVADRLGLHSSFATEYEIKDGLYTGNIIKSLADRYAKRTALEHFTIEYAFGDSEGDIEMLGMAEHAYCINPTPELIKTAEERSWYIYDGADGDLIKNILSTLREQPTDFDSSVAPISI